MTKAAKPSPIVQEGRLSFFASRSTTVVATTPLGSFKLFKVLFGPDGSIYLPFPYLETKRGLLSEVDPRSEPDPKSLDLRRDGKVIEYDAKFTHHTSGIVQFSQSGKGDLLPRRHGFRLDGPIGRLFELRFYGIAGFAAVGKKSKDFVLPIQFQRHPPNLRIWAEWRRKKDIIQNTETPTLAIGPTVNVVRRADGAALKFALLGQPRGLPLQDHVLLLSAEEAPSAQGADSPTTIFMGGWDQHEGADPQTQKMLSFMYPYSGPA
jgi:hypothetical protein